MSTKPRSKMKKAISIIGPLLILFLGSYLSFAHWGLSILAQELEKEITPSATPTPKPTPRKQGLFSLETRMRTQLTD